MINEHGERMGDALLIAAGGFESRYHPTWVIERKLVDSSGLLPDDLWVDADPTFYDPEAKYRNGALQPRDTYYYSEPVKNDPDQLRRLLATLRLTYPTLEFRMVIRAEMQKVLDF